MNITIYDVAREAGVSMATVSRVVNGNPNVKPTTRKKVMDVINRLGYRPNAVARGLASKKTTTIGVIIPDISNPIYAEMVRGIEDIATMYKYNIILSNSDQQLQREIHLINTLLEKQVDGLLFMGSRITDDHVQAFTTSPVPIILSATRDPQNEMASVNIDYKQATYDVAHDLIERGHQHIGFISGSLEDPLAGQQRLDGYREALSEAGLPFTEQYVRVGDMRYDTGLEAANELLHLETPPTAIFALSDEMAIGAIHACQDQRIRVPDDIEVVGFDNTRLTTMVRPELTSVVMPLYDMGAVSMRLLTKYINNETVDDHQVILPHRIEERGSTRNEVKTE